VLTQPTACALAERHLLSNGFESTGNTLIADLRCDGALQASGTTAELLDLEFKAGDHHVRASVCFRRGVRWSVDRIAVGGCSVPPSGTPSAQGPVSPGNRPP
jgi:hypothetical protein